jgi:hypothetical protein
MGGLALAIFIGLYMFGAQVMHLPSGDGNVQLALFLSFILGIICGYRTAR